MELTPLIFDRQFSRFDKQIRSQSGEGFTSFKEGITRALGGLQGRTS